MSADEKAGTVEVPDRSEEDRVMKEARDRFARVKDADKSNRDAQKDDTKFVWEPGAQWPDSIRTTRDAEERPWLEINQLPQFIKQVVNDQRQIRPSIRIRPSDARANKDTAKVIEGSVRGIEYQSNADAAYDSAFECAVTGGRGYLRVLTEYESEMSFNQVIRVQRIADPLAVLMDTDYVEPDGSDIKFCFVLERMSKDDFETKYPQHKPASWEDIDERWVEGDDVFIADYFRVVEKPRKLALLMDGSVVWRDELPAKVPQGAIIDERDSEDREVEWFKLFGGGILEEIEWPGRYIPIVMCVGDETMVDGKRIFQGLIRRARDPQTMYNFWQTAATELIALAPRTPWVAAEGQVEDYEAQWQASNTRSIPVLKYKPQALQGTLLPPPQRTQFAGVPTGIVEQANQCKADLRASIGIYDPSLGNRSNETSGRAIIAREKQGDTATFHFVDNLRRAISLTGRIIVDLIPKVYDTPRLMRTIEEDGAEKMVPVNRKLADGTVENDLRTGNYAVVVDVGPNYATRRMEAADSMMQFLQSFPQASPVIGDLVAKSMDWPGAEQIAERLKLMLPPPILQAEANKPDKDNPQVALLQQQLQEVTRQGHEAVQTLQGELEQATAAAQETQAQNAAAIAEARTAAQAAADEAELNRQRLAIDREKVTLEREKIAAERRKAELDAAMRLVELQQGQLAPLVGDDDALGGVLGGVLGVPSDDAPMAGALTGALAKRMPAMGEQMSLKLDQQSQMLIQLVEGVRSLHAMMMAPRERKLTLGPDGLPTGSIETITMPAQTMN